MSESKRNEVFTSWLEEHNAVLKMWEDSYTKIYDPWSVTMEEVLEKMTSMPKEYMPEKYEGLYDEWTKIYQKNLKKFKDDIMETNTKPNKEVVRRILSDSESSFRLYKLWIRELETNSKKVRKMFKGDPDLIKYNEYYDTLTKSCEKIFYEFLSLPAIGRPKKYKEFYDNWMNSYKYIYDGHGQFSKDMFENFIRDTTIYLDLYRSWIITLEKMLAKTKIASKQSDYLEVYEEFSNVWINMYEKVFNTFFDDMPMIGPMKEIMEPVKVMTMIYTDIFINSSKIWIEQYFSSGRSYIEK